MYLFQINLISFNCVVYDSKCPILSPTLPVCNTGRKAISDSGEVFSALVSVSGAFGTLDSDSC